MMISRLQRRDLGRAEADEQTANVVESIQAAGKLGLPVVEYNFYAHRLIEGYKEEIGPRRRRLHRLRLRAVEGPAAARGRRHAHARAAAERAGRFLKAVVPEAEKAERPAGAAPQRSAGAAQPRLRADHGHVRALEEVSGPGQEPVQRHDLRLRRHARDWARTRSRCAGISASATASTTSTSATSSCARPTSTTPRCSSTRARSTCSAVMQELVQHKYPRGIYPEHPRAIDVDRERGRHPEPVSRRRRIRRRDLQRRLRAGDAAGGLSDPVRDTASCRSTPGRLLLFGSRRPDPAAPHLQSDAGIADGPASRRCRHRRAQVPLDAEPPASTA